MEHTDNLIEQYIDGALTGAALESFQQRLQSDPELRDMLALHRQGRALLGKENPGDEAAFRQILNPHTARHFAAEAPARSGRMVLWKRLALAAALLSAVFAGLKWYAATYYRLETILAQHYAPAATPATLSGSGYNLQEAYAAYRGGQYEAAARAFEAVPADDPQYAEAMLFAGYARYESGQYAAAAAAFGQVIQTGDVRFAPNAGWHRLLAALAENSQSEETKTYLQQILSDTTHPFYRQAVSIQRKLNSPLRQLAG
jgi:TolA-binding protein